MDTVTINTVNTFLTIAAVFASIVGSWYVTGYRVGRLEQDRKEDRRAHNAEREKDIQNLQATDREVSSRVDALDARVREHTGNLYEGLDDVRGAGGILESRVSAIETTMQPDRVHEFNRDLGAKEARLSRAETDIRRLEEHLLEEIRSNRRTK